MNLKPDDIVILYDDPKFFYIVWEPYRYKKKYINDHLGLNYFTWKPEDPRPTIEKFEYVAYSSASNNAGWVDFWPKKDHIRLATEEEKKLIDLLIDENCYYDPNNIK